MDHHPRRNEMPGRPLVSSTVTAKAISYLHLVASTNSELTSQAMQPTTSSGGGPLGVIIPVLTTGVFISAVVLVYLGHIREVKESQARKPEVAFSAYLCKDGNIEFEYRIIFRVGCPSAAFDMNKAFIDLELLGPEKENLSDLVRFNLAKLPNRICGEMHLLLGRMNEIPTIYGIRARHSDQFGSIFLYELLVKEEATNRILQVGVFNSPLTDKLTEYEGKKVDDLEDVVYSQYIPTPDWTTFELAIIGVFLCAIVKAAVSAMETFDWYPFTSASQDGSLYRSLTDIAIVGPIMAIIMCTVTLPYKYFLKRQLQQEQYAISLGSCLSPFWTKVNRRVLISLLVIAGVASVGAIVLGVLCSLTKSLYIWSSTAVILACVYGTWATGNKSLHIRGAIERGVVKRQPIPMDRGKPGEAPPQNQYAIPTNPPQNTIFFSAENKLIKMEGDGCKTLLAHKMQPPKITIKKKTACPGKKTRSASGSRLKVNCGRLKASSSKKKVKSRRGASLPSVKHRRGSSRRLTRRRSTKNSTRIGPSGRSPKK